MSSCWLICWVLLLRILIFSGLECFREKMMVRKIRNFVFVGFFGVVFVVFMVLFVSD